jgi:predicted DNA binding CopG/RHH family protein
MSTDRRDTLLDTDWSSAWDSLPEAPDLVPRRKTAQITLRLPPRLLARIKAVAAARSLPYHALTRSWLLDGLRHADTGKGPASVADEEAQGEQLNIKLDQEILDQLKARASQLRRPYHRLAREWIESAVAREEGTLGIKATPAGPPMKDLMVLLLHAPGQQGDPSVRGITRLQKLLFVIEQKLASDRSSFYAFNYGPFNEEVNDAAEALRIAGFLSGGSSPNAGPPSFAEMMATAVERAGPRDEPEAEEYALSERGHAAAERLRQSSEAYERLYAYVRRVREEWDTPDLIDRVYEVFPKYTERSLIREKVNKRIEKRRSRGL